MLRYKFAKDSLVTPVEECIIKKRQWGVIKFKNEEVKIRHKKDEDEWINKISRSNRNIKNTKEFGDLINKILNDPGVAEETDKMGPHHTACIRCWKSGIIIVFNPVDKLLVAVLDLDKKMQKESCYPILVSDQLAKDILEDPSDLEYGFSQGPGYTIENNEMYLKCDVCIDVDE